MVYNRIRSGHFMGTANRALILGWRPSHLVAGTVGKLYANCHLRHSTLLSLDPNDLFSVLFWNTQIRLVRRNLDGISRMPAG